MIEFKATGKWDKEPGKARAEYLKKLNIEIENQDNVVKCSGKCGKVILGPIYHCKECHKVDFCDGCVWNDLYWDQNK